MNGSDDYLTIDTPENVAFGYDVAGIGSRFLAAAIDTIFIVIILIIVNFAAILLARNLMDGLAGGSDVVVWLFAIFGLLSFTVLWGYYIMFEMIWNGQSPGKRWIGLRVLRADGTSLSLLESIIRNLIRLVDFLPMFYGIGVVTMFISSQARRLGDLAAGTLVVHDRAGISLESLSAAAASVRSDRPVSDIAAGLPIERLTDQDIEMIEDFMRRRTEISAGSGLVDSLVQALCIRMEVSPLDSKRWEQEFFLRDVLQLARNRQSEPN